MSTPRRVRGHRIGRIAVWATLAAAASVLSFPTATTADPGGQVQQDAQRQAALVAAEDRRLDKIRAVTAAASLQWTYQVKKQSRSTRKPANPWQQPFRVNTGNSYTLVLTKRANPYTLADLVRLAPQTFVKQPDGAYLLTESIYLDSGAQLALSDPAGLVIRMASGVQGFVSIVSFGGVLTVAGTEQGPVKITSWDPRTGQPDTDVTDGRAYIRAVGGQLSMDRAALSHLGFWSGRTGGLSLTGTDRPDLGAIAGEPTTGAGSPGGNTVDIQRSGELTQPTNRFAVPVAPYVTGRITHSSITGDAFGFFASSARGLSITDTTVEQSLADGIVMHRFVTDADVQRVVSRDNGRDGFALRATQQVQVRDSVAERNGRNGFTVNGQPLADGLSASGESTAPYGVNSVLNSVARANSRYGIEIAGGLNVAVRNNRVENGDMGVVIRGAADTVTIADNTITEARRHGISVRDGVVGATITGNVVRDVTDSIYIRDSYAAVRGNTVDGGGNHGISLVGNVSGTVVASNVVSGTGSSAIDAQRARGSADVKDNRISGWSDTRSFWGTVRHYASPMTLLWTAIVLLILLAGSRRTGRRRRHAPSGRYGVLHPYGDKLPLPTRVVREFGHRGRAIQAVQTPAVTDDAQNIPVSVG
ncbi:right-handed parallel beta-helix repeat-containing protein [Dactylosporangium sp. NPDC048998]|uniref:right-handed parallel beta-helix repeat-containing protein n=1 Tax=Dactylosporangium sp. NPDC048998 TaxID=3363976 RepID=UPI003717F7C6